jgi:hypothetical protein
MSSGISKLFENRVTEFLSGMDLGADIVLSLHDHESPVRLICMLPCETQANKLSASDRKRYSAILGRGDDENYLNFHYIETCIKACNKCLVNLANIYWRTMTANHGAAPHRPSVTRTGKENPF